MEAGDKERHEYLAKKWLEGTLSADEVEEYNAWYDQPSPKEKVRIDPAEGQSEEQLKTRMFEQIKDELGLPTDVDKAGDLNPNPNRISLYSHSKLILKIVAISLFAWICYKFFYKGGLNIQPEDQQIVFESNKDTNEALPATDRAILKLADGRTLILDRFSQGPMASQGAVRISKTEKGRIVFRSHASVGTTTTVSDSELLYNTLITPKGGKFMITLADGSNVWLNAASSLRFPASFKADNREVTLNGEAYFEVAKNVSKPFLVHVKEMEVKVKGTHFNINAYEDDGAIHTTLLEGVVDVSIAGKGSRHRKLQPGTVASIDRSGRMEVTPANTDQAIAWKNNLFQFERTDLTTLLKEISRWYNIDVELKGPGSEDLFTGTIPRSIKLSTLLSVLDYSNISFNLNGRKLVVYTTGKEDKSA